MTHQFLINPIHAGWMGSTALRAAPSSATCCLANTTVANVVTPCAVAAPFSCTSLRATACCGSAKCAPRPSSALPSSWSLPQHELSPGAHHAARNRPRAPACSATTRWWLETTACSRSRPTASRPTASSSSTLKTLPWPFPSPPRPPIPRPWLGSRSCWNWPCKITPLASITTIAPSWPVSTCARPSPPSTRNCVRSTETRRLPPKRLPPLPQKSSLRQLLFRLQKPPFLSLKFLLLNQKSRVLHLTPRHPPRLHKLHLMPFANCANMLIMNIFPSHHQLKQQQQQQQQQ